MSRTKPRHKPLSSSSPPTTPTSLSNYSTHTTATNHNNDRHPPRPSRHTPRSRPHPPFIPPPHNKPKQTTNTPPGHHKKKTRKMSPNLMGSNRPGPVTLSSEPSNCRQVTSSHSRTAGLEPQLHNTPTTTTITSNLKPTRNGTHNTRVLLYKQQDPTTIDTTLCLQLPLSNHFGVWVKTTAIIVHRGAREPHRYCRSIARLPYQHHQQNSKYSLASQRVREAGRREAECGPAWTHLSRRYT